MKQVASHFGGTWQGMAICWPNRIKDAGGIRTQFHHMIDIVPTILEATGIMAPLMVNGIAQKPIEGVSMTYTLRQVERQGAQHPEQVLYDHRRSGHFGQCWFDRWACGLTRWQRRDDRH
jgi:arylsulfatase A-like enzyme